MLFIVTHISPYFKLINYICTYNNITYPYISIFICRRNQTVTLFCVWIVRTWQRYKWYTVFILHYFYTFDNKFIIYRYRTSCQYRRFVRLYIEKLYIYLTGLITFDILRWCVGIVEMF